MATSHKVFLCVCCLAAAPAFSQKIKYKDLFELLRTKQYETAEPFLKQYLAENDDNPNACLFMGIICQEKSMKADLLRETDRMIERIDSALLFYDKAYKMIDEKEVRRNKDYYEAYSRRDLRTGEFGVNLSDIQFDLEKKQTALKERIVNINLTRKYFTGADSIYKKCQENFLAIQAAVPGRKEFLLRADEKTLIALESLGVQFDSCLQTFERYRKKLASVGPTSYNQGLTLKDIADFNRDGASPADFLVNDLQLWNYRKFADESHQAIQGDIMPMEKKLVTYDIELNKLREHLNTDSVSVKEDLVKLTAGFEFDLLKKYDPDPMPVCLFDLRVLDLAYKSAFIEHSGLRDSMNVFLQLQLTQQEVKMARALDSLSQLLAGRNIDDDIANYDYFVTVAFHSAAVFKSYVRTIREYSNREFEQTQQDLAARQSAFQWLIVDNDTIPIEITNRTRPFKPLYVDAEKFTSGLVYKDSVSAEGYLFTITPSRRPDVNVRFPVDKVNLPLSQLDSIRSLNYTDPQAQVFFVVVYSTRAVKQKYPATVAKIYRTDGLAWSKNLQLAYKPESLEIRPDTGDVVLTAAGQPAPVRIDKNGKPLQ